MEKKIKATLTALIMVVSLFFGVTPNFSASAEELSDINMVFSMEEHSENELHVSFVTENEDVDDALLEVLDLYFKTREDAFREKNSSEIQCYAADLTACSKTSAVLNKEAERANAYSYLEGKNIYVTDSATEAYVEEISSISESQVELTVYEWTWIDYSNERGNTSDLMGFATTHTLVAEKQADESFEIISDIYDDSDMTGAGCAEQPEESLELQVEIGALEENNNPPALLTSSNYNSLNVEKVVQYADRYIKRYAYGTNYTSYYNIDTYGCGVDDDGDLADCANYVSQCLYAGGLPMTSAWKFYSKNSNGTPNCTAAWSGAISLEDYLETTCGYNCVSATASNVFPGNPVWANKTFGHVAICVGYNSSGIPIVNAHTADRYHVPYTFYSNPQTVQVTSYNKWGVLPSSAAALTITTISQSVSAFMNPSTSTWFTFTASYPTTYTFSATTTQASFTVQAVLYEAVNGNSYMNPVVITGNDEDETPGNFSFSTSLTAGKTYYLRVYATNSGTSGNFTLYYRRS